MGTPTSGTATFSCGHGAGPGSQACPRCHSEAMDLIRALERELQEKRPMAERAKAAEARGRELDAKLTVLEARLAEMTRDRNARAEEAMASRLEKTRALAVLGNAIALLRHAAEAVPNLQAIFDAATAKPAGGS